MTEMFRWFNQELSYFLIMHNSPNFPVGFKCYVHSEVDGYAQVLFLVTVTIKSSLQYCGKDHVQPKT